MGWLLDMSQTQTAIAPVIKVILVRIANYWKNV